MNLYEYWDALCAECDAFHKYAWEREQYERFRSEFAQKNCRKVLSTFGRHLGIASPSVMTKFIINKYKTGRVIKQPKPDQMYQAVYFDGEGEPAAVEDYADMHPGELCGRSETTYFVKWQDAVWTARYSENRHILDDTHFKIVYDAEHRLTGFYHIDAGNNSLWAEEYDYSEAASGTVTCLFTYYVGKAHGSSKDIPIGFSGSPASQWKYIIEIDEKGTFRAMTTCKNQQGEFVRNEHVDFEPSCKLNIYGKKR